MTESGWLSLANILVTFFLSALVIWTRYKSGQDMEDIKRARNKQHAENSQKLDLIHTDINGRVAELVALQVKDQVAGAIAEAIAKKEAADSAAAELAAAGAIGGNVPLTVAGTIHLKEKK